MVSFDNATFLCSLRRRLGLAVLAAPLPCEGCGRSNDAHGHHRCACTRAARLHDRHRGLNTAWRQVFVEAGGNVPDRNVERMLRNTNVPVPPDCNLRVDLVVPGLSIERGLPLFCDATCISPITGRGEPRSGTVTANGALLRHAARDNNITYNAVIQAGVGRLLCLSAETYGRWGEDPLRIVPALAWARTEGLPAGLRRGVVCALQTRWWGILSCAVQRLVAHAVLTDEGADLVTTLTEPAPCLADLSV